MARTMVSGPTGFEDSLIAPADPVSTYVRPATPQPSALHDLADSLSNFSHNISGLMDKQKTEQDDADKVRGQAAALKANGVGYQQAVQSGDIPTYASPLFVKSYKQAQGEIIGKRIAAGAVDAYQTWGGRNSQDPNDFYNFLGGYIKTNINTDDPDVLAGALPYISGVSTSLNSANQKERSDALYQDSIDAHIANSSMSLDNAQDVALTKSSVPDYTAMWGGIMADRDKAIGSGVVAADYDKAVIAMVKSSALEHMDPAMLGMLKNKIPGQNYSYADSPDGKDAIDGTITTMEARQSEMDSKAAAAQKAKDEAAKDANDTFAIETLAKDPNAAFDPKFIDSASQLDPKFQVNLKEWSKTLAQGAQEDPQEVLGLQEQILNGGDLRSITDNLGANGAIKDPATLSSLYNLYNSTHSKEFAAVEDNQTYKDSQQYLASQLTSTDLFAAKGFSSAAIQARADLALTMSSWIAANPNATRDQVTTKVTQVVKEMQGGINADKYVRPAEVTQEMAAPPANQPNGEPSAAAPGAQKPVPDPALTPRADVSASQAVKPTAAPGTDPWRGSAPPALGDLTQDQQNKINSRAAEAGVSADSIIKNIYGNVNGKLIAPPTSGDGQYLTPSVPHPPGMVEQGNIDLSTRDARVDNPDGSYSTVATIGVQDGGKEVVIPTIIPNGTGGWKHASDAEAEDYYHQTGQNFGKFTTPAQADAYAEALHEDQAKATGGRVSTVRPGSAAAPGDGDQSMVTQPQNNVSAEQAGELAGAGHGNLHPVVAQNVAMLVSNPPQTTKASLEVAANGGSPVDIAMSFLNKDERNATDVRALSAFFSKAGMNVDPSKTPWCAAFANAVLRQAGYKDMDGNLWAKSFLNYGTKDTAPHPGDIAVFGRGPNEGHVAFVAKVYPDGTMDVLGGNQATSTSPRGEGDAVNVHRRPITDAIGFRVPIKATGRVQSSLQA